MKTSRLLVLGALLGFASSVFAEYKFSTVVDSSTGEIVVSTLVPDGSPVATMNSLTTNVITLAETTTTNSFWTVYTNNVFCAELIPEPSDTNLWYAEDRSLTLRWLGSSTDGWYLRPFYSNIITGEYSATELDFGQIQGWNFTASRTMLYSIDEQTNTYSIAYANQIDGKHIAYTPLYLYAPSEQSSSVLSNAEYITFAPSAFFLEPYETISALEIAVPDTIDTDASGMAILFDTADSSVVVASGTFKVANNTEKKVVVDFATRALMSTGSVYRIRFYSKGDTYAATSFPMLVDTSSSSPDLYAGDNTSNRPLVSVNHYLSIAGAIKTLFEMKADKTELAELKEQAGISTETRTPPSLSISSDELGTTREYSHLAYDSELDKTYENTTTNGFFVNESIANGNLFASSSRSASQQPRYNSANVTESVRMKLYNTHQIIFNSATEMCYYWIISNTVPVFVACSADVLFLPEKADEFNTLLASFGCASPSLSAPYVSAMSIEALFFWNEKEQCCYFYDLNNDYLRLHAVDNKDLTLPENAGEMYGVAEDFFHLFNMPVVFDYSMQGNSFGDHSFSIDGRDFRIVGCRFENSIVKMTYLKNNVPVKETKLDTTSYISINDTGRIITIDNEALSTFLDGYDFSLGKHQVRFTVIAPTGTAAITVDIKK